MVDLKNKYLYAKGTCNVVVRDVENGDVVYQSNKVQTNQFATTCDMGEITAGIGNATAINIPHNNKVTLTITNADFSMAARAMQVGTQVGYNGVAPVCEAIVAASTQLTVSKDPAAPYGYAKKICNVVEAGAEAASGVAYEIGDDRVVEGFVATVGKTYQVTYFTQMASAEHFTIGGAFNPGVYHVTAQIAVYSAAGVQNALQGSKVGDLYYIIPRMQFGGKADISGDQTTPTTTDLSGTALSYDEANVSGECADCAVPGLAMVLYVPVQGAATAVEGLVIVGGEMTVGEGDTLQVPVKWLMPDGTLAQPDYTLMTYQSAGTSVATISATGLITGVAEGDTEITCALTDDPTKRVVANLTVE